MLIINFSSLIFFLCFISNSDIEVNIYESQIYRILKLPLVGTLSKQHQIQKFEYFKFYRTLYKVKSTNISVAVMDIVTKYIINIHNIALVYFYHYVVIT